MKRRALVVTSWFVALFVTILPAQAADKTQAETAVSANNAFAIDLYAKLSQEKEGNNILFSPFSVITALTMTAEGAREYTAAEMHRVLHLPADLDNMHKGLANLSVRYTPQQDTSEVLEIKKNIVMQKMALEDTRAEVEESLRQKNWDENSIARKKQQEGIKRLKELQEMIDPTEITVANALWGEHTYPFRQGYIDKINDFYGTGGVREADFKKGWMAERIKINDWAEKQTREKIRGLLPSGSLNKYTRLVLVNAIYFKGEWTIPFEKGDTRGEPFTRANGTKVNVSLMRRYMMEGGRYGAFEPDGSFFDTPTRVPTRGQKPTIDGGPNGFSIVELPYRGGKLAMVFVAPNRPEGLKNVEKQLAMEVLTEWLEQLHDRKVHVFVPRFRMETSYMMNDTLIDLGMKSVFKDPRESGGAKFGGMTTSNDPMEQLYVDLVMHKAFVDVNEEGTEAAAATAVSMAKATSMPKYVPFTPTFRADRPFLYILRDIETGCILFMGRMADPDA